MLVIINLLIFPTNKIYEGQFLVESFLEALLTCWPGQICKFQIYSFVFYGFVNFLCISLFLFLMYFFVFMIFFFCVILSWLIQDIQNCANGQKDKINIVLEHFKKISNFHVFYTQTYVKCGFWAIFEPTCEYKKLCDLETDGPIFANLVSKDA